MKRKLERTFGVDDDDDIFLLLDFIDEVRKEGYLSEKQKVKKIVDYLSKFEL